MSDLRAALLRIEGWSRNPKGLTRPGVARTIAMIHEEARAALSESALTEASRPNADPFGIWRGVCGHVWDRKIEDTPDCPRCDRETEHAYALGQAETLGYARAARSRRAEGGREVTLREALERLAREAAAADHDSIEDGPAFARGLRYGVAHVRAALAEPDEPEIAALDNLPAPRSEPERMPGLDDFRRIGNTPTAALIALAERLEARRG